MKNVFEGLISDEAFDILAEANILNTIVVRNYAMYCEFKELRKIKNVEDSMWALNEKYNYIQYDTIKKIVYGKKSKLIYEYMRKFNENEKTN